MCHFLDCDINHNKTYEGYMTHMSLIIYKEISSKSKKQYFETFRARDPNIFHLYHDASCGKIHDHQVCFAIGRPWILFWMVHVLLSMLILLCNIVIYLLYIVMYLRCQFENTFSWNTCAKTLLQITLPHQNSHFQN